MTTITAQRDLLVTLKRETYLNIQLLCKVHPMPETLSRQIFQENILDKPTQNVFNNLSHYLITILDPQASISLPWPLYDTAIERAYRNAVSKLITEYSNKGLVSPVMSSYLVNPGCFKVTVLIFQLSQLAIQNVVTNTVIGDQLKLYNDITEKYKCKKKEGFVEAIDCEIQKTLCKFADFRHRMKCMGNISDIMQKRIAEMEHTLNSLNPQKLINNLVDSFLKKHSFDDETTKEILLIKNLNQQSRIFDVWLQYYDDSLNKMEDEWVSRVKPYLAVSQQIYSNAEALIDRHTGQADKSSYMIEYNPKTDEISTTELQNKVNSEQKYILKNIVKNDRLIFPNLIRGFVIAICHMLKNMEMENTVFIFNQHFEKGLKNYTELICTLKGLVNRIADAEGKLNPSPLIFKTSMSLKELTEIPPLPDLSSLKMHREIHNQTLFESLTPYTSSKHQFNLHKGRNFTQPKSLMSHYQQGPRDDFVKNLISCKSNVYNHSTISQNIENISIISRPTIKGNETIAGCSSGFTKQQIMRLLSTKKSSTKKHKFKHERSEINIKKGLFDESIMSNESSGLFRSYSSPNLTDNKEKRSLARRKLSIMPELSQAILEMSGIAAIDSDNSCITPESVNFESTRKLPDTTSLPVISITAPNNGVDSISKVCEEDFSSPNNCNLPNNEQVAHVETPKNNSQSIRKTGSLEKIINRFKKVRASGPPTDRRDDEYNDIKTIVEEKENFYPVNVDVFTANRVLLPDLLSPSCNMINRKSSECLDNLCFEIDERDRKKPRESLGTALGVDETFLDQFDIVD